MSTRTADLLSFALIAVSAAIAAWLYPSLPDAVPSHWNAAGEVDGHTRKSSWGIILFPALALFIWGLMKLIPAISPKGFKTDEFKPVLNVFQVVLVGFLSMLTVLGPLQASGIDIHVNVLMPVAVGLLLIVFGNYMGKVRKNYYVGIRTPWTLANDEVWSKTHRLGGWMFTLAGLLMIVGGLTGLPPLWIISVVVMMVLVPVVYSYVIYRRLEGFNGNSDKPSSPGNPSG